MKTSMCEHQGRNGFTMKEQSMRKTNNVTRELFKSKAIKHFLSMLGLNSPIDDLVSLVC